MTKRSAALAAALCTVGLLTAGCLLPADNGDVNADQPQASASSPTPPRPSSSGRSLEGAFTYDQMDEYVNAVLQMIEPWIKQTWPGMSIPQVSYVERGFAGREGCLDANRHRAEYTSESYEYCPADQTVYVGQDTLWDFYTHTGDAGPAVGLAHEFGHHIQTELGVAEAQTAQDEIRIEDQADCLAGAWTEYTDQQGWLEYPDDIQDIQALFPLIGSAEGADRDHGTASEREEWFNQGFKAGIAACGLPH